MRESLLTWWPQTCFFAAINGTKEFFPHSMWNYLFCTRTISSGCMLCGWINMIFNQNWNEKEIATEWISRRSFFLPINANYITFFAAFFFSFARANSIHSDKKDLFSIAIIYTYFVRVWIYIQLIIFYLLLNWKKKYWKMNKN